MQITWTTADRRSPLPLWAAAVLTVWLALVVAMHVLSDRLGVTGYTCPFRAITGRPCPSCGLTRAGMAILHGRFWEGWTQNPLMVTLLAGGAVLLVVRLVTGRTIRLHLTRRQRYIVAGGSVAALLANWAYLLLAGI